MKLYVLTDEKERIVAVADEGFHLSKYELEAEFADELVMEGHVEIYDDRMIPLYCLIDGVAVARSQEEMDAEYVEPEPERTAEERIAALEEELAAAKILLGVE